jgi:hypothetical protein
LVDNELVDNIVAKNRFIDECLLTAMNFLGTQGYDMRKTCEFIIQNSTAKSTNSKDLTWRYELTPEDPNKMFKRFHRFYAKRLHEAVITSPDK